jgi:hypothetical protein
MKPATLVSQLLEADGEQEREPTPSLTAPGTGMSRYPEDKRSTENAVKMVGDGQTPDMFFVTIGDEFVQDEPGQVGLNYAIGQFDDPQKAEKIFGDVELSGEEGPRWVQLENRLTGLVKQRFLRRVVSYEEVTKD